MGFEGRRGNGGGVESAGVAMAIVGAGEAF